ncbi:MAG: hypothetical protein ACRD08_20630 [Acidimicrobiales bacterium]
MRFKMGVAVGFAAGYWVASKPADERRAQLEEALARIRGNPRLQRVADTVSRDAKRIGDAVEQRMLDTTDGAADAIAGTVEPDDDATTKGSRPPPRAQSA